MRWMMWLGLLYWPLLIIAVAVLAWWLSGGRGRVATPVMRSQAADRSPEIANEPSPRAEVDLGPRLPARGRTMSVSATHGRERSVGAPYLTSSREQPTHVIVARL